MDAETKICTKCNKSKDLADFIGKHGGPTVTCAYCRGIDGARRKGPKYVVKLIKAKEANYSKTHREKQKATDPNYHINIATIKRNWYKNNNQHVIDINKKNFNRCLFNLKTNAMKANKTWSKELNEDICYELMISDCTYCGDSFFEYYLTLDCLDSSRDYELKNVTTACYTCNDMKGCFDPVTFVERCKHITKMWKKDKGELFPDTMINGHSPVYSKYKEKGKKCGFDITQNDFMEIIQNPCHYCKKENIPNKQDRKSVV